jgi:hypothetical protein
MATGGRRGQVYALRWNSVSSDNVLAVHRSVDFERGTFSMSSTRSNSPRDIALDDETASRGRAEHKLAEKRH